MHSLSHRQRRFHRSQLPRSLFPRWALQLCKRQRRRDTYDITSNTLFFLYLNSSGTSLCQSLKHAYLAGTMNHCFRSVCAMASYRFSLPTAFIYSIQPAWSGAMRIRAHNKTVHLKCSPGRPSSATLPLRVAGAPCVFVNFPIFFPTNQNLPSQSATNEPLDGLTVCQSGAVVDPCKLCLRVARNSKCFLWTTNDQRYIRQTKR